MKDKLSRMTREEEAAFWETHSSADYWNDSESVEIELGPRPHNTCPVCGRILLSRFVDVDVSDGRAILRGMRELYCPQDHKVRLAPEAQQVIGAIEAVLQLVPERARLVALTT